MTIQADSGQHSCPHGEALAADAPVQTPLVQGTDLADGGVLLQREDRMGRGSETVERARVITMVWGDRYVDDLLHLTVPAMLAPGNLPAFAAQFQTELVVVTEMRMFERFRSAPVIGKVLEICDVRLLPIDDLLSPWYGITLTYALVRGFADLGPRMVDTHLVFINADFILANGSYRKLAEDIRRGERLVVSPSYCMNLENTVPHLRAARDKDTLAISIKPRDMARLLIENRHNTIRAKTANQQLFRIHRYDQFYWYVNSQTLLARQMPIAMVYMRPERVLTEMPTFWDYGVISEYCPSIKPCVLGDSDEFLMAELRTSNTFSELLHLGWPSIDEIAADLSFFTTQDHRDYGRHTLVLHSADLPANFDQQRQVFNLFVDSIYQKLSPPISYRDHHFWAALFPQFAARQAELAQELKELKERARRGLEIRNRADSDSNKRVIEKLRHAALVLEAQYQKLDDESFHATKDSQLDTELKRLKEQSSKAELQRVEAKRAIRSQVEKIYTELELASLGMTGQEKPTQFAKREQALPIFSRALQVFDRLYDAIFGRMPNVTVFNPRHAVVHQALAILSEANRGEAGSYLFLSSGGEFGSGLKRVLSGKGVTITPAMARSHLYEGIQNQQFVLCFCELSFEELFMFRETFEKVRPYMSSSGKFVCFYYNVTNVNLDNWTGQFIQSLFPLVGRSRISFTGSRVAALNMRLYEWMYRRVNYGALGMVRTGLLLLVGALLARISELIERRRNPHVLPKHCTSMTIEIDL